MTYRLSTDRSQGPDDQGPLWGEARDFVDACGIPRVAPVDTFKLADALYRLVGPDPSRVKAALALLKLVEAGGSAGCDVRVSGFHGTVAVEDPAYDKWHTESYEEDDLGDACRRLLAQLKGGGT